jgi:hypothetical protein
MKDEGFKKRNSSTLANITGRSSLQIAHFRCKDTSKRTTVTEFGTKSRAKVQKDYVKRRHAWRKVQQFWKSNKTFL